MNQSEQIDKLAEALAKAQGFIVNPAKNKKVKVKTKAGGSYEFSYADLTAIMEAIKGPLSANGLCYSQLLERGDEGKYQLVTKLMHSSGQWIASITPLLVDEAGNQPFGSALTFMKRYSLAALVGVAADSDDDANAADGNQAEITDRTPKQPAPSPLGRPQPATLQSAPRAIPLPTVEGGGHDWAGWGKTFIDMSKASENEAEADKWLLLNQHSLHMMMDEAPKVFQRLKAATAGLYPQLLLDIPDENILNAG